MIQVVQVIIDIREGSDNAKTRYAMHAVTADNGSDDTTTQYVTDAQTLTVSNNTCTGAATAAASDASGAVVVADGTATGTAIQAAATDDVGAPFLQSNQTMIAPADSGAPQPGEGASVVVDPALELALELLAASGGAGNGGEC